MKLPVLLIGLLAALMLVGCERSEPTVAASGTPDVDISACVACHGADGISPVPNYPNLAGQKYVYLVTTLRQYQSGQRSHPVMAAIVADLDDETLKSLARYYADRKPCPP